MPKANQLLGLIQSHVAGDDEQFRAIALQVAAHEARQGHAAFARELRDLIERSSLNSSVLERPKTTLHIAQPRGELAALVTASFPTTELASMVLSPELRQRLERVVLEQHQSAKISSHGLQPRRKLLLIGPPGSGKTMTASALAGELKIPLFTIQLESVLTKYLGETASKLRTIFDAMTRTRAVFLFDEFDAIGSKRSADNDVGEIRRILNSFLQFLENDRSQSIIVCATNHPSLLDRALYRRFDDVLRYSLPDRKAIEMIFKSRLHGFETKAIDWKRVREAAKGLSQADLIRAAEEAAKNAVLSNRVTVTTLALIDAIRERKGSVH